MTELPKRHATSRGPLRAAGYQPSAQLEGRRALQVPVEKGRQLSGRWGFYAGTHAPGHCNLNMPGNEQTN